MKKTSIMLALLMALPGWAFCQSGGRGGFSLVIVDEHREPISGATVRMLQNGKQAASMVAGEDGRVLFALPARGKYRFLVSHTGFQPKTTEEYGQPEQMSDTLVLLRVNRVLQEATVTAHAATVERHRDRTVVNVEASVTNTGATVLEVLERSPGVTVDRNGGIALNGKQDVLVMIDDKPTYLSGDDLNNLLSSMNASQVARIELVPNPAAKYDAGGSGGIINIRTKKNRNDGFNGSITTSYGQGVYPKSNNSLVLNYRKGPVNAFLNYSYTLYDYLTNLYAYRTYYDDSRNMTGILETPAYNTGSVNNHTLKTGLDYSPSAGTSVGLVLTGMDIRRKGNSNGRADWLQADGQIDSSILTRSVPRNIFRNGAIGLNGKQRLSAHADLSADLDYLHYAIEGRQDFNNQLLAPGGYEEIFRSRVPTTIDIFSGKVDAVIKVSPDATLQTGVKTSSSHTDNASTYENLENQQWLVDETRSNHFIYRESIKAVYGTMEGKYKRLSYQAGLRYEYSSYTAHQFGNSQQKDSVVKRNYGGLFPSGYLSYAMDSLHSFTLSFGRRLDRPVFQNLNPFLYIINKYTYQTGNAYLLPQYSWNIGLSHQYGSLLTTGINYTRTSNYFSQIFLSDSSRTILYYTQGNVGKVDNLGITASLSLSPVRWWSLELTAVFNHKQLKGFNGNSYKSTISQLNVNVNNQLDFGKGYSGELSGFYTTRAREDIQELLYPAGQMALGFSKTVFKKKGTIKLGCRDIFYTAAMEGFTSFPSATEYFKLKRDTRVITIGFTYRFGRSFKVNIHQGGAGEEKDRVPNG